MFLLVSETFLSNEVDAFPMERTRTVQRNHATCQTQDTWDLFEGSVTLFSFTEMVLPSNIDKS